MLNQKAKKIIACLIMGMILFFVFEKTEASSRRLLVNQDRMEEMIANHKKIDLNGNLFDLYINTETKTVTVRGEIVVYDKVDWNEVDKVKKFFTMENHRNYEFVYEFKFIYNS